MAESRNTPAASTSREASHAGEANTAATEGSEQNTTAGYIAGKRGFPLVSLDQVTDEKLRRVLAQQAPAAKAQEGTVAAEAVSEVLQEAVADMGIPAQEVEPACDPELRPNGHGARTVIDPSLVPDDDLDAYREDTAPITASNMVTEAALTRPSQPVPMTGMIPQVPNSHAARRYGADPAAMPKTGPVSMPTTSVPLVDRGAQGLPGLDLGDLGGGEHLVLEVVAEHDAHGGVGGVLRLIDLDDDGAREHLGQGVGVGQPRLRGGQLDLAVVLALGPVRGVGDREPGVAQQVGDPGGQPGLVRAVVDVDGDGGHIGRLGVRRQAGLCDLLLVVLGGGEVGVVGDREYVEPHQKADDHQKCQERDHSTDHGGLTVLEPTAVLGAGVCGAHAPQSSGRDDLGSPMSGSRRRGRGGRPTGVVDLEDPGVDRGPSLKGGAQRSVQPRLQEELSVPEDDVREQVAVEG